MRKNNKGFTLIEMLIVVAIIAILVAVSIPVVGNSLERARVATDAANERAAKAEAILLYLNGTITKGDALPYNAAEGKFEYSVDAAGVATADGDYSDTYGKCTAHKGDFIKVTVEDTGNIKLEWSKGGANHDGKVDS